MAHIFVFLYWHLLMQVTDVKNAWMRLLVIPLAVGFVWLLNYAKLRWPGEVASGRARKILLVLVILLGVARVGQTIHRLQKPRAFLEDQAALMMKSTRALLQGKNFYREPVDQFLIDQPDGSFLHFDGHKYTPLQNLFYGPWTEIFDLKGMYVGNIFAYIAICILLFAYLQRSSLELALFGVLLFLSTDFVYVLAFNNGTTDFYPTVFALASQIHLVSHHRENKWPGILLGLSIASKQMPGAFFAIAHLIQLRWRTFLISSLVFWAICLPFFIWDYEAFYRQIFLLPLVRPDGPISLFWQMPSWVKVALTILGLLCLPLALLGRLLPAWNMASGFAFSGWGLYLFISLMKMSPTHYYVWCVPFLILWVGQNIIGSHEKY